MARFQQVRDYQPISQAYTPTTLKYIDDAGQSLQNSSDLLEANLTDAQKQFNIIGGYHTNEVAKQVADEYQKDLIGIHDQYLKDGNAGKASQLIGMLKNKKLIDPRTRYIESDLAEKQNQDKARQETGFDTQFIKTGKAYGDPFTFNGNYKQATMEDIKNGIFDREQVYGVQKPGNTHTEWDPEFGQIKENTVYEDKPQYDYSVDANGNTIETTYLNGKKGITPDDVYNQVLTSINKDPNKLNKSSYLYNKHFHNLHGEEYTPEQYAKDVANSYVGEHTEDIKKVVGSPRIIKAGDSKKNGNGGEESVMPNKYGSFIDKVNTPKLNSKGEYKTGTAQADAAQMSALIGGNYDDKTGNITANLTGKTIYISTPEQVKSEGADVVYNQKVSSYYNNYMNALRNYASEFSSGKTLPKGYDMTDATLQYVDYKNPGKKIHYDANSNSSASLWYKDESTGKRVDIGNIDKWKKDMAEQLLIHNPKLLKLKDAAIADGVDLNDKKTQDIGKSYIDKGEAYNQMNTSLQSGILNGEFKLIPANDNADNFITDKKGDGYGRNYVELTQQQLATILPTDENYRDNFSAITDYVRGKKVNAGYKKLVDDGILKPVPHFEKDGTTSYSFMMPVIIKANTDSDDITEHSQINSLGLSDKTRESITTYQSENANKQALYSGIGEYKNVLSSLNSGAYKPEEISKNILDYNNQSNEKSHIDPTILKSKLDQISKIPDKTERNKILSDLRLRYTNYNVWLAKQKSEQELGKPTAGQTK